MKRRDRKVQAAGAVRRRDRGHEHERGGGDDEREAWPTEEFELVHSEVETTLPEDDLFAGVRELVTV